MLNKNSVEKYKNGWKLGGAGGHDTLDMYKNGFCLTIPRIKQIWHYGLFNFEWWGRYIFYLTNIKKRL